MVIKRVRKFDNINYPIFCLSKEPFKITYSINKIECQLYPDSIIQTIDDKSLSGDFFSRLLQLNTRLEYDFTCRNVQDLVYTKAKWGIDSNAMPHNLSKLYSVPVEKRIITKVEGSIIWIRGISYPFELPTTEKIRLNDTTYATLVNINGEWLLREFSYDRELSRPYMYV